jgi:ElaB/YqjD/DUF883 family membrane-anchored ribosome-binding protein
MNAEEREFSKTLENMDQVDQLEETVAEQSQQWLRAADQWVRRNPYLALGIAAAAGCVLIALMRGGDED